MNNLQPGIMENYVVSCGGHLGPNPLYDDSLNIRKLSEIHEDEKMKEERKVEAITPLSASNPLKSPIEEPRGKIIDVLI